MYLYIEKDVYYEDKGELPEYKTREDLQEEPSALQTTPSALQTIPSLVEHTFKSNGGYFVATPKVEIIRRTRSDITFMIPFHGQTIRFETKDENNNIIEQIYEVVRP